MKDAHLVSSSILDFIPKTYVIWSSIAKRALIPPYFCPKYIISYWMYWLKKDFILWWKQLEEIIKSCENVLTVSLCFGHNAITNFVNKFGDVSIDNVPTSGFVSLEFDTEDWEK
jgi:phosphohistidine phosphatase